MMAMTTSNSTSVNAPRNGREGKELMDDLREEDKGGSAQGGNGGTEPRKWAWPKQQPAVWHFSVSVDLAILIG